MLAYARAERRALRCVPWLGILPMKASITLHCNPSCIHATHFPTHYKLETGQKNACKPPPRLGDSLFSVSPGPACGGNKKRLIYRFFDGGAGGPSTIFTAMRLYGCTAVLLPCRVPPYVHNLQNKQWCQDTRTHLCGCAAQMWIPPIKR